MRWKDRLGSPRFIRKLNLVFTLIWLVLIVPTLLVWTNSVLWVAVLSIWANVVSHYTAWVAARVEVRAQDLQAKDSERIAQMDAMVDRIERQNLQLLMWAIETGGAVEEIKRAVENRYDEQ